MKTENSMTVKGAGNGVILPQISDRSFEAAGTFFGLMSCVTIATQIHAEHSNPEPSTLSYAYVLGFGIVYLFWTLYGIRFRKTAIWLTNSVGVLMQALLLAIIIFKAWNTAGPITH